MRLNLALAALPLLLSAQLAFAADDKSKVDFDQGPSASAILDEARQRSGVSGVRPLRIFREIAPSAKRSRIPVPPLLKLVIWPPSDSPTAACDAYSPEDDGRPSEGKLSPCPETEKIKTCPENPAGHDLLPESLRDLVPPPGTVFGGPFGPMPQGGAIYRDGLGLRNQVEASPSIPDDTRGVLLKDWAEIESVGSGLTSDGNGLDVDDGALYTDAQRLNLWADRIDARLAIGKRLADQFNRDCRSGRTLPSDEAAACNKWAIRFNSCVDRHNASVKKYDQAAAIWDSNYDKLKPRVDGFRVRLLNWENLRIKPFIEQATKALAAGCRMATSLTIVAPPSKVGTTSPGGESVHYVAKATYASKPEGSPVCDLAWSIDNVLLGTLSPQTGSATVFKPNRIRGSGVIKVAEKVSGLSDTGSIIVQGGRECIKTGEIRTPPAGPNEPFKVTCTYTCPFTGPQVLFLSDPRGYPSCPPVYEP